jgi:3D (Asp-Asp-Asp) domain-containing protein
MVCCGYVQPMPEAADRAAKSPLPRVTVVADGEITEVRSPAATVSELLEEVGVSLSALDRTFPSPSSPLLDGLEVQVTRVTREEGMEEVTIPMKVVVLADPNRPAGFSKVLAHGQDGRVRREYRVWEKDGEETVRGTLNEKTLVKPKDTVILRGTHGAPSRGGDWRRPLRMEATAYDPGPLSCGKYASGYTATGAKAEKGVVAIDDRVIPMGTRLYIPGYGFAVAADRGSAIKGMRIDLCFPTRQEALNFGRRKVHVYLLD